MVSYDGSEAAERALAVAADLVGYGSTLSVVTVHPSEIDRSTVAVAREQLQRRHVDAHYHEVHGAAAEQLVAKAHELRADLIVIGRNQPDADRALLGSVCSTIVRCGPCDVLVVR